MKKISHQLYLQFLTAKTGFIENKLKWPNSNYIQRRFLIKYDSNSYLTYSKIGAP
jgi:hypothetical protein